MLFVTPEAVIAGAVFTSLIYIVAYFNQRGKAYFIDSVGRYHNKNGKFIKFESK